jgi:tyrosyl-tRNA synthetase
MATHELDLAAFTLNEQLDWLLEGTYFADEGGLVEDGGTEPAAPHGDDQSQRESNLRAQMRAELRAKLELSAKLKAKGAPDWPLRIYIGADPTRTSLHIGHMVPVVFLRKFQQLGHQTIFLIGDYTATIGDPSGANKEREQLSHAKVLETAKFYTSQAYRLLHEDTRAAAYASGTVTELGAIVRFNGSWLAELKFAQIAELAAQFPLGQVVARQDFRNRLESGAGVRLHECLYMLMQGYDAYALNCDVQVGGYDQHFNLLAGRILQKHFSEKLGREPHPLYAQGDPAGLRVRGPHVMLTCPLLMGTDGRKMSKSWGNTIDVLDEPYDMFGKTMRISDEMIAHFIDIAVAARQSEKDAWKARIPGEPMEVKKWVAHSLTALYCGAEAADAAAEHFKRTVQERQVAAEDVSTASFRRVESTLEVVYNIEGVEEVAVLESLNLKLVDVIVALKLQPSKKEATRLIEQGGVKLDGEAVTDKFALYEHKPGAILQVGKRKVVKLV